MRSVVTAVVAVMLTVVLWSGGRAFADDMGRDRGDMGTWCDSDAPFGPGAGLGPVRIGMPLDALQRWYGRPRSVENRQLQGHRWTHMRFTNLDVMARDNAIVAVNALQSWPVPAAPNCPTQVTRPFNLPVRYVQQTWGPPVQSTILNGLQYWLYDKLGLLLTIPVGGTYVQGLTVYQPSQFCNWVPVFVSFGGFTVNVGNSLQCPRDETRER
ncbi:MAG TPA: hypothetical protein VJT33_03795 [bacterium]|nr:hypothetical protein [bacterium]